MLNLIPSTDTLPEQLIETLTNWAKAAKGAYAENTFKAWRHDLMVYWRFCFEKNRCALPASEETVVAFIEAMGQQRKPVTIQRYLASIVMMHNAAHLQNPGQFPLVKLAMKTVKRQKAESGNSQQVQAKPLNLKHLAIGFQALKDRPIDIFTRALISLAYDGLLRTEDVRRVCVEHFTWFDEGDGQLRIPKSKTDQEGEGRVLYVSRTTHEYIDQWLQFAQITQGSVFRPVDKSGRVGKSKISDKAVTRAMQRVAKAAGLDHKGYSGHSCRVGAAQDLMAQGVSLPELMVAGRWKSDRMPIRYTENIEVLRSAMAKLSQAHKR